MAGQDLPDHGDSAADRSRTIYRAVQRTNSKNARADLRHDRARAGLFAVHGRSVVRAVQGIARLSESENRSAWRQRTDLLHPTDVGKTPQLRRSHPVLGGL